MADPARNLDEPQGQVASDASQLALVQSPQTRAESQWKLDATPNFDSLFRAKLLRRAFKATKRMRARPRPQEDHELHHLKTKSASRSKRAVSPTGAC